MTSRLGGHGKVSLLWRWSGAADWLSSGLTTWEDCRTDSLLRIVSVWACPCKRAHPAAGRLTENDGWSAGRR